MDLTEREKVLAHQQWGVIRRAIERYSAGEISDLVALGLIANGFLTLDEARRAALATSQESSDNAN